MANYYPHWDETVANTVTGQYQGLTAQEQQYINAQNAIMYGADPSGTGGLYNAVQGAYGYGPGWSGPGLQGFNPTQQANILGLDPTGQGLAGVSPMSQGMAEWMQLSPQEQAAISGNPSLVYNNALDNTSQLGANVVGGNQNVMGAAYGGAGQIEGSINPSAIGLSPAYRSGISNALDTEGQQLGAAVNNPNLNLSQQFRQNYQFTPQNMQDIINQAGTTVGNEFQSAEDQLKTLAQASGQYSPTALAASLNRMELEKAAQAGDAMTTARLQAKQVQLGVQQTAEQMRLGASQDISSRQMQAGESLAGSTIGALNTGQQMAINAALGGQGLSLNAAEQAAMLPYGAAQFGANQLNQATEYATGANMSAGEYANNAATQQAALLAQNRQNIGLGTQQMMYNQGMGVNNAMSSRYGNIYNTQLTQEQIARAQMAAMYGQAGNWQQQGYNQLNQGYSTPAQIRLNAYGQGWQETGPSAFQTVVNTVGGLVGAVTGGGYTPVGVNKAPSGGGYGQTGYYDGSGNYQATGPSYPGGYYGSNTGTGYNPGAGYGSYDDYGNYYPSNYGGGGYSPSSGGTGI